MPMYVYRCKCNKVQELLRFIADRNLPAPCPSCGGEAVRHAGDENAASTDQEYQREVLSESMGVSAPQVAEARRMHPDINYTSDGRVILRSHSERKRVMKKLGFFDRDGY